MTSTATRPAASGPADRPSPERQPRVISFSHRLSRWDLKFSPYLYISPFFIVFAIVGLFPIAYTAVISFQDWDLVRIVGSGQLKLNSGGNYMSAADGTKLNVAGGTGDDHVKGGSGNDKILGSSGNDVIEGGSGKDVLEGGSGNDRITGGAGADILTGGSGTDRFVFKSAKDSTSSARDTMGASRWQPLPVLTCTAATPVARIRSASFEVCWSPSTTATGRLPASALTVRTSSEV